MRPDENAATGHGGTQATAATLRLRFIHATRSTGIRISCDAVVYRVGSGAFRCVRGSENDSVKLSGLSRGCNGELGA